MNQKKVEKVTRNVVDWLVSERPLRILVNWKIWGFDFDGNGDGIFVTA
nr:hypothetical protein [Tanacetum cinerariifolium]